MPITESVPINTLVDEARSLSRMFDLTKHNLGVVALQIAAQGVEGCFALECDPSGIKWAALSPGYEAWKQTTVGSQPIGRLYGVMSDPAQIMGVTVVYPQRAGMTYGISDEARIEAVKFQEGGVVTGTSQPRREFYGFTTIAVAQADAHFDAHFYSFKP